MRFLKILAAAFVVAFVVTAIQQGLQLPDWSRYALCVLIAVMGHFVTVKLDNADYGPITDPEDFFDDPPAPSLGARLAAITTIGAVLAIPFQLVAAWMR